MLFLFPGTAEYLLMILFVVFSDVTVDCLDVTGKSAYGLEVAGKLLVILRGVADNLLIGESLLVFLGVPIFHRRHNCSFCCAER